MALENQYIPTGVELGILPTSDNIYHHYGNAAKLLERPSGKKVLVLHPESGNIRVRLGDRTGSGLSASDPSSSVTDGSGSINILEGQPLALHAPSNITFISSSATGVTTYYWI